MNRLKKEQNLESISLVGGMMRVWKRPPYKPTPYENMLSLYSYLGPVTTDEEMSGVIRKIWWHMEAKDTIGGSRAVQCVSLGPMLLDLFMSGASYVDSCMVLVARYMTQNPLVMLGTAVGVALAAVAALSTGGGAPLLCLFAVSFAMMPLTVPSAAAGAAVMAIINTISGCTLWAKMIAIAPKLMNEFLSLNWRNKRLIGVATVGVVIAACLTGIGLLGAGGVLGFLVGGKVVGALGSSLLFKSVMLKVMAVIGGEFILGSLAKVAIDTVKKWSRRITKSLSASDDIIWGAAFGNLLVGVFRLALTVPVVAILLVLDAVKHFVLKCPLLVLSATAAATWRTALTAVLAISKVISLVAETFGCSSLPVIKLGEIWNGELDPNKSLDVLRFDKTAKRVEDVGCFLRNIVVSFLTLKAPSAPSRNAIFYCPVRKYMEGIKEQVYCIEDVFGSGDSLI